MRWLTNAISPAPSVKQRYNFMLSQFGRDECSKLERIKHTWVNWFRLILPAFWLGKEMPKYQLFPKGNPMKFNLNNSQFIMMIFLEVWSPTLIDCGTAEHVKGIVIDKLSSKNAISVAVKSLGWLEISLKRLYAARSKRSAFTFVQKMLVPQSQKGKSSSRNRINRFYS